MEWGQVIVILIPLVTFMGFIWKEMREWRQETRDETNSIRSEIAEMRKVSQIEIAEMRQSFQEGMRVQSQRSDTLYQMFIDLLKEQQNHPRTNP